MVTKGGGITETERYLANLCQQSFLSLWSYPGIHNDKGCGQEICDLLVIFGDHLVIFSDKNIKFSESGELDIRWKRWYRKAVSDSVKQLQGAERWIRQYPDRIFLDHACTQRLPLTLPASEKLKIHLVVVTHGIDGPCREYFRGGSGSLLFDSDCKGDQTLFTVGKLIEDRVVHVLGEASLEIVLQTLDTAPDFIEYLDKKENFLASGLSVSAAGEEEFLGHYLDRTDNENRHDFMIDVDLSELGGVVLEEGFWHGFTTHPKRQIQREANRISYFWDTLIEDVAGHVVNGTTHLNTASVLAGNEQLLRFLAMENRTQRRFLSDLFIQFVTALPSTHRGTRTLPPSAASDTCYVFLGLPQMDVGYEQYREVRHGLLASYTAIAKLDHPEVTRIIGIGTESGNVDARTYDLVYLDARDWTSEQFADAEADRNELITMGHLAPQRRFNATVYEYPPSPERITVASTIAAKGSERNRQCTCGSGRKAKKCCGAAA